MNPQTNGGKVASYNPHSRLSQNLATALKCLHLDKLANKFLCGIDIYMDCKCKKSDSVIKYEVDLQYLQKEILEMQKPLP